MSRRSELATAKRRLEHAASEFEADDEDAVRKVNDLAQVSFVRIDQVVDFLHPGLEGGRDA